MLLVRKLVANLGLRALLVLGPLAYLHYLLVFFQKLSAIRRAGDFKPLDQAMGARPLTVRVNGVQFTVDCPHADQRITDGTFVFGIIRELYIRNCYLRFGVAKVARTARTVLDLGANRGVFSLMMAPRAELVVAVEFNPRFRDVIAHNMVINGFTNYRIETAFVGDGGAADDAKQYHMTLPELLQKYNLEHVDLLKMDIEGSEFALFRSPGWLSRISALCMEVHPKYGDPAQICLALKDYGFDYVTADVLFKPVKKLSQACFIYAWKPPPANCYQRSPN